jgi:antitoxin YefM
LPHQFDKIIELSAHLKSRWLYRKKEKKSMKSLTATEARKQFNALLEYVAESHETVQIVGKRNSAVLISEEDWRSIQETLYPMSVTEMNESTNLTP